MKTNLIIILVALVIPSALAQQGVLPVTPTQLAAQPFDYKGKYLKIAAPETSDIKQKSESSYEVSYLAPQRSIVSIIDQNAFNAIARNPSLPIYCGIIGITDTEVQLRFVGNEWVGPTLPPKWKQATLNR